MGSNVRTCKKGPTEFKKRLEESPRNLYQIMHLRDGSDFPNQITQPVTEQIG